MKISNKLRLSSLVAALFIVVMFFVLKHTQAPGTVLSNTPDAFHASNELSQEIIPAKPLKMPLKMPEGAQVVKSLLGLEVTFLNGHVNYPGPMIVDDPRYQALGPSDKLVDAIKFQPINKGPYLLLMAIGKKDDGTPIIVPGKFDVEQKTSQNGFILSDSRGRKFYYSGYVLMTPAWKNLQVGEALKDQFCKKPVPMLMCSPKNTVRVIIKKPPTSSKDIPMLVLIR